MGGVGLATEPIIVGGLFVKLVIVDTKTFSPFLPSTTISPTLTDITD